ncbi:hypothetical protein TNCV_1967921 [Trichonephila clavipes]|nr:hypothetical protein TNCV_1967921 [Trichonephila clavipes]
MPIAATNACDFDAKIIAAIDVLWTFHCVAIEVCVNSDCVVQHRICCDIVPVWMELSVNAMRMICLSSREVIRRS